MALFSPLFCRNLNQWLPCIFAIFMVKRVFYLHSHTNSWQY
ncbi:hypothetical protein PLIP_b0166 [Pseudoalteromonas lipolytica LMEB 39]|nr:hypothetical protein [Pseudoalteromonas lipolytica LMEB 39]